MAPDEDYKFINYYGALGLQPDATDDEIQNMLSGPMYTKHAKGTPEYTADIKAQVRGRLTLRDPVTRAEHDEERRRFLVKRSEESDEAYRARLEDAGFSVPGEPMPETEAEGTEGLFGFGTPPPQPPSSDQGDGWFWNSPPSDLEPPSSEPLDPTMKPASDTSQSPNESQADAEVHPGPRKGKIKNLLQRRAGRKEAKREIRAKEADAVKANAEANAALAAEIEATRIKVVDQEALARLKEEVQVSEDAEAWRAHLADMAEVEAAEDAAWDKELERVKERKAEEEAAARTQEGKKREKDNLRDGIIDDRVRLRTRARHPILTGDAYKDPIGGGYWLRAEERLNKNSNLHKLREKLNEPDETPEGEASGAQEPANAAAGGGGENKG